MIPQKTIEDLADRHYHSTHRFNPSKDSFKAGASSMRDSIVEWLRSEENNELILASIIESRFK